VAISIFESDGERVALVVCPPRYMEDYAYSEVMDDRERLKVQTAPESAVHVEFPAFDHSVIGSEKGFGVEIHSKRLLCHTDIIEYVLHQVKRQ
jgi:hypothetical protein